MILGGLIGRYTHWLHTQWPAGRIENLPVSGTDGSTNVPGLYVVGDLTGIPLLKFALDTGARAIHTLSDDPSFNQRTQDPRVVDVAIVGGGLSGYAAAIEAKKRGLTYCLIESNRPLSTLVNFPKGKPIYTYPKEMTPEGDLRVSANVKEALVEELESQIRERQIETRMAHVDHVRKKGKGFEVVLTEGDPLPAHRVIVAIGRSGNHRKLGVPGEDLDKVYNRLHDPKDFCDQKTLVVGGGDSALEAAIALAHCGSEVTLSYRNQGFSRPKPENVEAIEALIQSGESHVEVESPSSSQVTTAVGDFMEVGSPPGSLRLELQTEVIEIGDNEVVLSQADGTRKAIPNDVVFTMIGREAPLEIFRKSDVRIQGEWTLKPILAMTAFLASWTAVCFWKGSGNPLSSFWVSHQWFPYNLNDTLAAWISNPKTLLGTLAISATEPGFYYGLAYCLVVTIFGWRRINRRKTPYVALQTWTLILIQIIPLFVLPSLLLPWLGHNGWLHQGFADTFFPVADYGHGREYWRAVGFILAWPLFLYNVFTPEPIWGWLVVSLVQTFVLIPAMIYFYGKGAYCGWICSCGALAETLGDTHRAKMPHGPFWNRLNMAGQAILAFTFILLAMRILGWLGVPGFGGMFFYLNDKVYKFGIDLFLSGILGVGLYFWFSGRVWCRFFCPLAALMHIYHRFSRFRIFADKKKCISCNVCTSVCHQGIDVMSFANKGLPMKDPECVRCSACVQECPTGVLSFGQANSRGEIGHIDRLPASSFQMSEKST